MSDDNVIYLAPSERPEMTEEELEQSLQDIANILLLKHDRTYNDIAGMFMDLAMLYRELKYEEEE